MDERPALAVSPPALATGGHDVVCISPHLDDAALSCGGMLAAWRCAGLRVLVATLCTADPPPDHEPGADERAALVRWGLDPRGAVAARRAEDAEAMAELGADACALGLPDAMHRGVAHGSRLARWRGRLRLAARQLRPGAAMQTEPDPFAVEAAAACGALWRGSPDALVLAPLGVGSHPDHLAAFHAGRALAALGARVAFYEDLPYALDGARLGARVARLGGSWSARRAPIGDALDRKLRALRAYRSQLPSLRGPTAEDTLAAIAAHARACGGGEPAERIWLPPGAAADAHRPAAALRLAALALCMLPWLAGCVGRTDRLPEHPAARAAPLRAVERPMPPDAAPPPIALAAGDIVDVQLVGRPETAEACTLAPDGMLYFHAGPGVAAAGRTPEEAAQALVERLRSLYLEPRVSVSPRVLVGRQALVLGAVRMPGPVRLLGGERVLDLIAAARGLAEGRSTQETEELAELGAALYVRGGKPLPVDLVALLVRGDRRHDILVHPGDYLFIPSRTSREVEVLGAVVQPQPVAWRADLTIAHALARAGGQLDDAYLDRVVLLRRADGAHRAGLVDVRAILEGREADIPLLPRDVVYVPGRTFQNPRFWLDRFNTTFVQTVTSLYASDLYDRLVRERLE